MDTILNFLKYGDAHCIFIDSLHNLSKFSRKLNNISYIYNSNNEIFRVSNILYQYNIPFIIAIDKEGLQIERILFFDRQEFFRFCDTNLGKFAEFYNDAYTKILNTQKDNVNNLLLMNSI